VPLPRGVCLSRAGQQAAVCAEHVCAPWHLHASARAQERSELVWCGCAGAIHKVDEQGVRAAKKMTDEQLKEHGLYESETRIRALEEVLRTETTIRAEFRFDMKRGKGGACARSCLCAQQRTCRVQERAQTYCVCAHRAAQALFRRASASRRSTAGSFSAYGRS
jgi:hypothetical protein